MSSIKAVKYDCDTNTYLVYYNVDNPTTVRVGHKNYKSFKPTGNSPNRIISCRKK